MKNFELGNIYLYRLIQMEADAVATYLEWALVSDDDAAAVLRDVAFEEKVHIGEALGKLMQRDPELRRAILKGIKEAGKLGDENGPAEPEELAGEEEPLEPGEL